MMKSWVLIVLICVVILPCLHSSRPQQQQQAVSVHLKKFLRPLASLTFLASSLTVPLDLPFVSPNNHNHHGNVAYAAEDGGETLQSRLQMLRGQQLDAQKQQLEVRTC